MKRFFSSIFIAVFCFSLLFCPAYGANGEISVYLNGGKITFDVLPQIINGRTMVPIRAIFEAMGATVEWDGNTRTAICQRGNTKVLMKVDSMELQINDQVVLMDIAPTIINNRTLAPARFVAEAFGGTVTWDGDTRTVGITLGNDPLVTIYSLEGQTLSVPQSEVASYLNKGWSTTADFSLQTLYAPDGRTIDVYRDEVALYLNIGWYLTPEDAAWVYQNTTNQNTATAPDTNQLEYYTDDGTYKVHGGTEYHFDQACAGADSYRTRLEDVKRAGLTPCPKCAW